MWVCSVEHHCRLKQTVRRHRRGNHAQCVSCVHVSVAWMQFPSLTFCCDSDSSASQRAILNLLNVDEALCKSHTKKQHSENSRRDSINWRNSYWHLMCFLYGRAHPTIIWWAHFYQTPLLTVTLKRKKKKLWGKGNWIWYLSVDLENWCEYMILGSLNWKIMRGSLMAVLSCQQWKHYVLIIIPSPLELSAL